MTLKEVHTTFATAYDQLLEGKQQTLAFNNLNCFDLS